MVLFNHTGTNGFVLFTVAQSSALYPFYLFNAIFIKIAVPLFFMTSGALLLGKEESYQDLLRRRVFKYLLVLIVASLVAYLYTCLRKNPQAFSVKYYIKMLFSSNLSGAYWYLYAYLAYLLMLPLLRKLAKAMTDKEYLWLFVMFGMMQCLSIAEFVVWEGKVTHNGSFSFFITTNYIFYPLMGYYIDQRLEVRYFNLKNLLLLSAASFFAIVICCFVTQYWCSLIGEWKESSCQKYFNTLIFLPTVTVYYGAKLLFMRYEPEERLKKAITTIGGLTFGIYLTEEICRRETVFIFRVLKPYLHTLPACWVWIFCACVFGCVITCLLKKIPGVGKVI